MPANQYYIGVMSGSSLDGIDVALTDFTEEQCKVIFTHFQPYPDSIKQASLQLHFPSDNELEKSALLANKLAFLYADAIQTLLENNSLMPNDVIAIGCHGQTIRHQPKYDNSVGFTIQLGNNALLAELTGITVVGDFRSRDIAAGGEGAPLVPAFHQAIFSSTTKNRAIINIGGIANISYLGKDGGISGFDSGPGNMLIDYWVERILNKAYDGNGNWAATGKVIDKLLEKFLNDSYFSLTPPKSTGRDLFNQSWLEQYIANKNYPAEDIARTLTELTGQSICLALQQYCPEVEEVYLCGGGARNQLLVDSIQAKLYPIPMFTTKEIGVDVDWVEAVAFAWLAKQAIEKKSSSLPSVTGAKASRVLGAIHQA
ncbi:MAG: anhydro-N-acetylmuramic acid kinase [Methylotenera sp.]